MSVSMSVSVNDLFRLPFFGELTTSLFFASGVSCFVAESFFALDITSSIIGLLFPVSSFTLEKKVSIS